MSVEVINKFTSSLTLYAVMSSLNSLPSEHTVKQYVHTHTAEELHLLFLFFFFCLFLHNCVVISVGQGKWPLMLSFLLLLKKPWAAHLHQGSPFCQGSGFKMSHSAISSQEKKASPLSKLCSQKHRAHTSHCPVPPVSIVREQPHWLHQKKIFHSGAAGLSSQRQMCRSFWYGTLNTEWQLEGDITPLRSCRLCR